MSQPGSSTPQSHPPYTPQGQPPYHQQSYPQHYQPGYASQQPVVMMMGMGCPNCGSPVVEDYYDVCAILIAILCFPWGILVCILMRQKRCLKCGFVFGNGRGI